MEEEARMELTIPGLIAERARSQGGQTIMRVKNRGIWRAFGWADLAASVRGIAGGLTAEGIGRGDVVAILSENRLEAVHADLAILCHGAVSLAIDPDMEADQVAAELTSSGARLVFAENEQQLDKLLSIRDRCPALTRIVIVDMAGLRDFADPGCVALSAFASPAGDWPVAVAADDKAAIVDGETLTHADIARLLGGLGLKMRVGDERLAVLRLSERTERIYGLYLALTSGCISNYPEGAETVMEDLQELQPTVLGASAIVWDYLGGLAAAKAKDATGTQRWLYEWALRTGNRFILGAVREEFGLKRLRLAYTGGSPPSQVARDWARKLGIAIETV